MAEPPLTGEVQAGVIWALPAVTVGLADTAVAVFAACVSPGVRQQQAAPAAGPDWCCAVRIKGCPYDSLLASGLAALFIKFMG